MILRSVQLDIFGAKSGEKLEFDHGLNVVLGPNEAGKSTLVNALFAALFIKTDIHRRSVEWNNLLGKFMPYPHGDHLAVTVCFCCGEGREYTLKRSWGAGRGAVLILPDGSRIRDEESLQQMLNRILGLGRGTYEGVLFARQDEMLKTVELLKGNREAVSTLSEALRAAAFAAGGVSLDDLRQVIEEEKKELLGNWDLERDRPKGNRGIDQPWVRGVGAILDAFYRAEAAGRSLKQAEAAEKAVEELRGRLRNIRAELERLRPVLADMEKKEADIRRRRELEPRLALLAEKEKKLKELNEEWPKTKERALLLAGNLKEAQLRLSALEGELAEAVSVAAGREKRALLAGARPLQAALRQREEELSRLAVVTGEDLKTMEEYRTQADRQKAVLEAMKLKALLRSALPLEMTVCAGLSEPETVTVSGELSFDAQGRLTLETAEWKVEVQSGEGDVSAIIGAIRAAEQALQGKLTALGTDSVETARVIWAKRDGLERDIRELKIKLGSLLKDQSFAALESEVAALPEDKAVREPAVVMEEINGMKISVQLTMEKLAELENRLRGWEESFVSPETVLDELVTLKSQAEGIKKELAALSPLPAEYDTPEGFLKALAALREKARELGEEEARQKYNLAREESSLPEYSPEELRESLALQLERLARLKKRAVALLAVEEEFERLSSALDRHTFLPLEQVFVRYLAPFTGNRYDGVQLDGPLPVGVMAGGRKLPLELLSTGTTRGLALALRLAVAEHLLHGRAGFMVMDDPLVDLDPDRKIAAAQTIRQYSASRQLIVTTCDPSTAALLGGRVIPMQV